MPFLSGQVAGAAFLKASDNNLLEIPGPLLNLGQLTEFTETNRYNETLKEFNHSKYLSNREDKLDQGKLRNRAKKQREKNARAERKAADLRARKEYTIRKSAGRRSKREVEYSSEDDEDESEGSKSPSQSVSEADSETEAEDSQREIRNTSASKKAVKTSSTGKTKKSKAPAKEKSVKKKTTKKSKSKNRSKSRGGRDLLSENEN